MSPRSARPAGGRGVRAVSPRGHAKVRFMTDATHEVPPDWPLFGLRLTCGGVALRPAREEDLPHLAAIQPDDYEHDPRAEVLPGLGDNSIDVGWSTRAIGVRGEPGRRPHGA